MNHALMKQTTLHCRLGVLQLTGHCWPGLPCDRYVGSSDKGMFLRLEMTGSSKKMKSACAADPKELTTNRSKDWPFSLCLAWLKMRSLKMVARAGKNIDPTKRPAYTGLTCTASKKLSVLGPRHKWCLGLTQNLFLKSASRARQNMGVAQKAAYLAIHCSASLKQTFTSADTVLMTGMILC